MKCGVPEENLSALVDGELDAIEERRLLSHLAVCPACRAAHAEFSGLSRALHGCEAGIPPASDFVARVVSSARSSIRSSALGGRRSPRVFRISAANLLAAAAAAVLLLLGLSGVALLLSSAPASLPGEGVMVDLPDRDPGRIARAVARASGIHDGLPGVPGVDLPALADFGGPLPPLPGPRVVAELTGDELLRALGLFRAGDRWLSVDAYRVMREHREQEELLARAAAHRLAVARATRADGVYSVPARHPVPAWLGLLEPGTAKTQGALTVVALLDGDGGSGVELLAFGPAFDDGLLVIREDRSTGRLAAENLDPRRHVFLPAGLILVGGHQDRIVTRGALIPPNTRARLPVLCCEEGRSVGAQADFIGIPGIAPAAIRSLLLGAPDQSKIRACIEASLESLGSANRTRALGEVYRRGKGPRALRSHLVSLRGAFADERTVGFLAFAGGRLIGGEVFGSHEVFEILGESFLAAYLLDSLRPELAENGYGLSDPATLLAAVGRASFYETRGAVSGLETEFAGGGTGLAGTALIPVAGARPLHISLFPTPEELREEQGRETRERTGADGPVTPPGGGAGTSGGERRIQRRQQERRQPPPGTGEGGQLNPPPQEPELRPPPPDRSPPQQPDRNKDLPIR